MDIDLAMIRNAGWTFWDPIGLMHGNEPPDEAVDEYDSYLVQVVHMFRAGEQETRAIDFLMDIESEHMALGPQPDALERATKTVRALRSWPDYGLTRGEDITPSGCRSAPNRCDRGRADGRPAFLA